MPRPPRSREAAATDLSQPRELEDCTGCWSLRTVSDRQWVVPGGQAAHRLEFTLQSSASERTVFYYIYQGTYGLPGSPPAVYILDARENAKRVTQYCLRQRSATRESLAWAACPDSADCERNDCSEWGFEAVDAPDVGYFLRSSGCVGANCTYVGWSSPPSSMGLLGMTTLANASRFETVCAACPGAHLRRDLNRGPRSSRRADPKIAVAWRQARRSESAECSFASFSRPSRCCPRCAMLANAAGAHSCRPSKPFSARQARSRAGRGENARSRCLPCSNWGGC